MRRVSLLSRSKRLFSEAAPERAITHYYGCGIFKALKSSGRRVEKTEFNRARDRPIGTATSMITARAEDEFKVSEPPGQRPRLTEGKAGPVWVAHRLYLPNENARSWTPIQDIWSYDQRYMPPVAGDGLQADRVLRVGLRAARGWHDA